MTIRLVLADDHPIVLDGLEALFRAEAGMSVVARCVNAEETLSAVVESAPDVLILDLTMPPPGGLGVLAELRKRGIPTHVVVLTASISEEQVLEALRLDARGIVLKEMAPRLLVDCVRHVAQGGRWMERFSVTSALSSVLKRESAQRASHDVLSEREREVVKMIARGLRNKEIAKELFITEGTVKVHLHSIYEKLAVNGRTALAIYAREHALA
jgi:two-component system NarL family response regulator/two-component system nitrate/nitrite response regulator NarL